MASMKKIPINLEKLNTDSYMDNDIVFAELEALVNEAGDWRDHPPYEVALHFHEEPKIGEPYQTHIDNCEYCQCLIGALHPS